MKTKQEIIETFRAKIKMEANLEANAIAANALSATQYRRGRKEAFQEIADTLSIISITNEELDPDVEPPTFDGQETKDRLVS